LMGKALQKAILSSFKNGHRVSILSPCPSFSHRKRSIFYAIKEWPLGKELSGRIY